MTVASNDIDPSIERDLADNWGVPVVYVRLNEPFEEVVSLNPKLRIEQNASGEVVFMSPTGGESGYRNSEICRQLASWSKGYGGRTFDSSTLFSLPNGAKRSPDASWVNELRWISLSKDERKGYPPLSPDFVIELRSESDRLVELQNKMTEYLENGTQLGWLIDPLMKTVHVFQTECSPEVHFAPKIISCQNCLP